MKNEQQTSNISYMEVDIARFIGQENSRSKVQYFAGSSVVKIHPYVKMKNVGGNHKCRQNN